MTKSLRMIAMVLAFCASTIGAFAQSKVTVNTTETTATFVWPTDDAAQSYRIDIYKDGVVCFRITLSPEGYLLGLSRSVGARYVNAMPNDGGTLSFMATGLDEASKYDYVLAALDAADTPLHVFVGCFATVGYPDELELGGDEVIPTPPVIPNLIYTKNEQTIFISPSSEKSNNKLMKDGEIVIVKGGELYDLNGKKR